MIKTTELRLVLVTPETTLLDEPVKSLSFPLYDGKMGVLPGRAPVVGRLGVGELKIQTMSGQSRFLIEGGFLQIKGQVVTLLTNRATPVNQIDLAQAESELTAALGMSAKSESEHKAKQTAIMRARQMRSLRRG